MEVQCSKDIRLLFIFCYLTYLLTYFPTYVTQAMQTCYCCKQLSKYSNARNASTTKITYYWEKR